MVGGGGRDNLQDQGVEGRKILQRIKQPRIAGGRKGKREFERPGSATSGILEKSREKKKGGEQ